MNNCLALDTSTSQASVALTVNGNLYSATESAQSLHAQLLLPMIDKLLQQAAITVRDLDAIVFGRGPGSFTGLRIGCSIAKGLAYTHDLPLFPVSSLMAIAASVQPCQEAVLALMDARMHQVYWAYYPPNCLAANEQVSDAAEVIVDGESPVSVVGADVDAYYAALPMALQVRIISKQSAYPNAEIMLELAQSGKINAVSAAEAAPVYVRNQVFQTKGGSNG